MKQILFILTIFLFSCSGEKNIKKVSSNIAQLSQEILENPSDIKLLESRKKFFLERGNIEAALIDQLKLIDLDSTNYIFIYELAVMQYKLAISGSLNYYNKSLNTLSKVLELNDKHPESLLLRAELYYLFKKHKESLIDLNKFIQINPYDAKSYFYKGLIFKDLGYIDKANNQFQTAIEQNPYYQEAYEQLAFIYDLKGDSLAEYYFNNALSVDSSDIQLWYNKGKYLQDKGRFNDAKKCYKSILRRDKFNQFAHYNLGYIYLMEDNYKSGANHFSEATYTDPNYVSAFFARGLCFKKMGNFSQAKLDFQHTLKLDPFFKEAQYELNKIP